MKFYSEILNKQFDTADECVAAEKAYEEEVAKKQVEQEYLKTQRKARAAAIEEAREKMVEAQNHYRILIGEFVKDYGTYHYSSKSVNDIPHLFMDLLHL